MELFAANNRHRRAIYYIRVLSFWREEGRLFVSKDVEDDERRGLPKQESAGCVDRGGDFEARTRSCRYFLFLKAFSVP